MGKNYSGVYRGRGYTFNVGEPYIYKNGREVYDVEITAANGYIHVETWYTIKVEARTKLWQHGTAIRAPVEQKKEIIKSASYKVVKSKDKLKPDISGIIEKKRGELGLMALVLGVIVAAWLLLMGRK